MRSCTFICILIVLIFLQFLIHPSSITIFFDNIEISFKLEQSVIHPFSILSTFSGIIKVSSTGFFIRKDLGTKVSHPNK